MKTRPGTGALAAVVIAGSAAAGAGITAALTARHDGQHHRRHVHVRCVEASPAEEVAMDAMDRALAVEALHQHDATGKRKKRRRRCRRIEVTGDRTFVVREYASNADHASEPTRALRWHYSVRSGDGPEADARRLQLRVHFERAEADTRRPRLRLRSSAQVKERMEQANVRLDHAKVRMEQANVRLERAMERLEQEAETAQREAERLHLERSGGK